MNTEVLTIQEAEVTSVMDLLTLMQQQRVCYLPVVNEHHQLMGMITFANLIEGMTQPGGLFSSDKDYRQLAERYRELSSTNDMLNKALEKLQSAKLELQQANAEWERRIKNKLSDFRLAERLSIDRMKGEFVSVVSHELRTPLTAIHGGLQLITMGLVSADSQQGQELLQIAADSSQRLVRLVNDILDLERLESGRTVLEWAPVSSRQLTEQAVWMSQGVAEERQITIMLQDPDLMLMADGDHLIQVLTNLLDNAIKFSPEHATVWLSVEPDDPAGTMALFKVRDEGKGIPAANLADIFDRFTQVNYSDTRERGGTGLGLAICHNIIGQHGGKIWADSRLGQGSCFCFTVPLMPEEAEGCADQTK